MVYFIEALGWSGTVLVLLAYFLLTHKNLSGRSPIYHLLNIVGALFLGINAFTYRNNPSMAINIIWIIIAIYGLASIPSHRASQHSVHKAYKHRK